MEHCPPLFEYMEYVSRVRTYQKTMSLEDAVNLAVDECIRDGILKEFLLKNKAGVIEMSIFEYDEELHMKTVRQEGYDSGRNDIIKSLYEANMTIEEIADKIKVSVEEVERIVTTE